MIFDWICLFFRKKEKSDVELAKEKYKTLLKEYRWLNTETTPVIYKEMLRKDICDLYKYLKGCEEY